MKVIIKIVLPFFCIFLFSNCNKDIDPCEEYPDVCEKLIRDWEIETLTINGIDSLPSFMTNPTYCLTYRFEHLSGNHYLLCYDCVGNAPSHQYWGDWILGGKYDRLFFNVFNPYQENPILNDNGSFWTIEQLTDNQLWLRTTNENSDYVVHFKAK